jgi:hypothetical protein
MSHPPHFGFVLRGKARQHLFERLLAHPPPPRDVLDEQRSVALAVAPDRAESASGATRDRSQGRFKV